MNYLKKYFITLFLIAVNIAVFIAMIISGVNFLNPDVHDLIWYGANFNALLYSGEYYRIITHLFVHVGIIHLAANMIALYSLGCFLEEELGKFRYLSIYLLSGIAGGLLSASYHSFIVSTGASGAIMGLAGSYLAFILNHAGTGKTKFLLFMKAFITVLINLLIGFLISFIDNAAHMGGLVFGFIFSYILIYISSHNENHLAKDLLCVMVSFMIFSIGIINLPSSSYTYYVAFNKFINYERIIANQSEGKGYIETDKYIKELQEIKNTWNECHFMLDTINALPDDLADDIRYMKLYASYKMKSLDLYMRAIGKEEYELLDSMEYTNAILAIFPKPKHGIPPSEEKKEPVIEKNNLRNIKLFYDKNWKETDSTDALYYREAQVDSLNRVTGFVDDYFIDGRIQMKGVYFNDLKNGIFRFYFHDGNYESMGKYVMDEPVGKWKNYYHNGQIKEEQYYSDRSLLLKNFWDSLGTQLVINGSGIYITLNEDGSAKELGNYRDGLKDGTWQGDYSKEHPYYIEKYEAGKLINGISYSLMKDSFQYLRSYISPQPVLGMQDYNTYLKKNLKYPENAVENKIEGVVLVDITIGSTGKTINIENVNKLGYGCEEEAKRLIMEGCEFHPAVEKGQMIQAVKRIEVLFELEKQ